MPAHGCIGGPKGRCPICYPEDLVEELRQRSSLWQYSVSLGHLTIKHDDFEQSAELTLHTNSTLRGDLPGPEVLRQTIEALQLKYREMVSKELESV